MERHLSQILNSESDRNHTNRPLTILYQKKEMKSIRNTKKEYEWAKKVYKSYNFRARTDNGEVEKLEKAMNGKTFGEWVREQINK